MHPEQFTGVMGTARRDRGLRKRGRPVSGEGSDLSGDASCRFARASDRAVGALRLGNSGGAKGPDFWCVFHVNEVG